MKTVVVTLRFKSQEYSDWSVVTENSVFGKGYTYSAANAFINAVKALHKKHSYKYEITQIVIG